MKTNSEKIIEIVYLRASIHKQMNRVLPLLEGENREKHRIAYEKRLRLLNRRYNRILRKAKNGA